jgi:hypothetical protein
MFLRCCAGEKQSENQKIMSGTAMMNNTAATLPLFEKEDIVLDLILMASRQPVIAYLEVNYLDTVIEPEDCRLHPCGKTKESMEIDTMSTLLQLAHGIGCPRRGHSWWPLAEWSHPLPNKICMVEHALFELAGANLGIENLGVEFRSHSRAAV